MKYVTAALLVVAIICAIGMPCMAEEVVSVNTETGFSVGGLVANWGPTVVAFLLAAGVIGWGREWLKDKVKSNKLLRRLGAERLIDVLCDRAVAAAESYSKQKTTAMTGPEKKADALKDVAAGAASEGIAATAAELDKAVEAAHARMTSAANFPTSASRK